VTTFADREHSIEAHQALLELSEFQDRYRTARAFGLVIATRVGLGQADREGFAAAVAESSVSDPAYRLVCERWAAALDQDTVVKTTNSHATDARHGAGAPDASTNESWPEFVIAQLFQLFDPAGFHVERHCQAPGSSHQALDNFPVVHSTPSTRSAQ
jgi:hypothetical protein